MNLQILDFAGQQVLSGVITAISERQQKQQCSVVVLAIKNKAFQAGKMVDTEVRIVCVDKEDFRMASWAEGLHIGQKISVLVKKNKGMLFAGKGTDKDCFLWKLFDEDGNERNVLYGPTKFLQNEARYTKVLTEIDGVRYITTFWNDVTAPRGERAKKVFEPRGSVQTFLVSGKDEPYKGVSCMRGFWFICDF